MATEGFTLVDLGELSKPVTVLIEKVSDAMGVAFEPHRIKRKAQADADADRIRAISGFELDDELERRAAQRFIAQERRKQVNIETIATEAVKLLPPHAKPEGLSEDWLANFFAESAMVSEADMQAIWARILAGEATQTGQFSKRTLKILADMTSEDASTFASLMQYCWHFDLLTPFILDPSLPIFSSSGIDYVKLKHLEAIGLVAYDTNVSLIGDNEIQPCRYFDSVMSVQFAGSQRLHVGKIILTSVGLELAKICPGVPNENFMLYLIGEWTASNLVVYCDFPRKG